MASQVLQSNTTSNERDEIGDRSIFSSLRQCRVSVESLFVFHALHSHTTFMFLCRTQSMHGSPFPILRLGQASPHHACLTLLLPSPTSKNKTKNIHIYISLHDLLLATPSPSPLSRATDVTWWRHMQTAIQTQTASRNFCDSSQCK